MPRDFSDIFADDPLGLLNVEPARRSSSRSNDQRLIDGFAEITSFFETNNREPAADGDLKEYLLYARLKGIRSNPSKVELLSQFDFYNLLDEEHTSSIPLERLIDDDPLGILQLEDEDDSIFDLKHVKATSRVDPDYVARRKVCRNFEKYEDDFREIADDLKNKRRRLVEFGDTEVAPGTYYVLNGVITYLETMSVDNVESDFSSGSRTRLDGRTRCIFDNGTESTVLMRSLVKALNRPHEGYLVSEVLDGPDASPIVCSNDVQNGYVYVLSSLSEDESVKAVPNLYKIGFSSGDVTNRIKNAEKEPTYLMAPVKLLRSVRCFNVNPLLLEATLHAFFSDVNIDFEIRDVNGQIYHPREWFSVPLSIIDESLDLLQAGVLDSYKYDSVVRAIVRKADAR